MRSRTSRRPDSVELSSSPVICFRRHPSVSVPPPHKTQNLQHGLGGAAQPPAHHAHIHPAHRPRALVLRAPRRAQHTQPRDPPHRVRAPLCPRAEHQGARRLPQAHRARRGDEAQQRRVVGGALAHGRRSDEEGGRGHPGPQVRLLARLFLVLLLFVLVLLLGSRSGPPSCALARAGTATLVHALSAFCVANERTAGCVRYIQWCMEKFRLGFPIEEFAHEPTPKKTIRGCVMCFVFSCCAVG